MADTRGRDNCETNRAVCFDRRDYAGPVRRMMIVCIDCVAALVLSFGALTLVWYAWLFHRPDADPPAKAVWIVPAVAYVYLTIIARSRIRSLGYLLTGMRIVDIRGGRPSLLQMTVRLLPLLPCTLESPARPRLDHG